MMRKNIKFVFGCFFLLFLTSCDFVEKNEKKFADSYTITKREYTQYDNNSNVVYSLTDQNLGTITFENNDIGFNTFKYSLTSLPVGFSDALCGPAGDNQWYSDTGNGNQLTVMSTDPITLVTYYSNYAIEKTGRKTYTWTYCTVNGFTGKILKKEILYVKK